MMTVTELFENFGENLAACESEIILNTVEKSFLHFPRECVNALYVRWTSFFRTFCINMFKIN